MDTIHTLSNMTVMRNIHEYPLVNLITLDVAISAFIGYWISKTYKTNMTLTIIGAMIINVAIHYALGIKTNMGRYFNIQ